MKMNLGFFSEEAANHGAETGAVDTQNPQTNQEEQETKTYTQKELDSLLQSEADRRVNQALSSFKEKELPELLKGAKSEAEKLAKMTSEQKAEHERQKSENELKEREARLLEREREATLRELKSEVISTLAGKGLPVELHEFADYTGAEKCGASIERIEAVFRKAVEDGINTRLKSNPPKVAGNDRNTDLFLQGFNENR